MAFYNESKFNMWRACIGVIWIDGAVSREEEVWIKEKISTLKFSDEQKKTLESDLHANIDFEVIFPKITDKRDRAFLLHQIRTIGHLDNSYSKHEKELFEKWKKIVLNQVDLEAMEQIIRDMKEEAYGEDEVSEILNKFSLLERGIRLYQKYSNSGD